MKDNITTGFSTGMIMDAINNQNIAQSDEEKKRINDTVMDNTIANVNPVNSIKYRKQRTQVRTDDRVGRNDPCPCGSGKKFKKCCMGNGKYDATYKEVIKRR